MQWILRPFAECLAKEIPEASIGTERDHEADVNLFINYALYRPVASVTMALFTHREGPGKFDDVARQVDWCFAMCNNTLEWLPKDKSSILPTYPTQQGFYKDLVLGVVGRTYSSGRKRMAWKEDLARIDGVTIRHAHGQIPAKLMPGFYDDIDYIVVLSENEGGPQPVIEAMARKCPVIAPDVGYCWDYPVIRYETKDDLLEIVHKLIVPRDGWRRAAQTILETYKYLEDDNVSELTECFEDPRINAPSGNPRSSLAR
jgi:glycosyltransferase involved in cell wall biosynthesis